MALEPEIVAILNMLSVPFYTSLGAFTLYVLNRLQKKQPFSLFSALNVDVLGESATPMIIFCDMILSSILGAVVVIPLTAPSSVPQAIIAGLGMTGILAAHTKETE